MNKILIVGATSAIAEATARRFAAGGDSLFLVARDTEKLTAVAEDLRVRGAREVVTRAMDADRLDDHGPMLDAAETTLGHLDVVMIAYGTLPDQARCQDSVEDSLAAWHTNAASPMALLTLVANRMERRGAGTIVAVSSVAGDRGRKSNYVYGSAKAALTTFLEGLRHRLHASGVRVVTVKPGMVDTPMTAAFPKGPLWARPEQVGRDIHKAVERGREVVYTPFFWRLIMLVVTTLPRPLFKRTDL